MGIVAQILEFFSFYTLSQKKNGDMQSIEDCMDHLKERGADLQLRTVLAIVKKFEHDGFLLKMGQKGDDPIYGATYVAQTLDGRYLEYGAYDFYYYGFSSVRNYFMKSVLPIEVTKTNGDLDIGTCFVIDANKVLTARHCIENMSEIRIMDPQRQPIRPSAIWVPADGKDIALIEMDYYNLSSLPSLRIDIGEVLDEILTMGYPPIPGFEAVNIGELTHIGAAIKVSEGRVIAEERTLFDQDAYFLINAKVKGGNSGGPIINKLGHAIGMIVDIPLDPNNQTQFDHLGYGVAVTGRQLNNFLAYVSSRNGKAIQLPFTITGRGFSTVQ